MAEQEINSVAEAYAAVAEVLEDHEARDAALDGLVRSGYARKTEAGADGDYGLYLTYEGLVAYILLEAMVTSRAAKDTIPEHVRLELADLPHPLSGIATYTDEEGDG